MTLTAFVLIVTVPPSAAGAAVGLWLTRAQKRWGGTPAREFDQLKCTVCRGGVVTLLGSFRNRHWGRIPDHALLLHRKPDGDTWGSPLANIKDCACCHGLGYHLVPADTSSRHLSCRRPDTEPADRAASAALRDRRNREGYPPRNGQKK